MRTVRTILLSVLLLACCAPLGAQSLSSSKNKKARLERDIRILEQQLNSATAKSNSAETQLNLLRAQTSTRRELLQDSEKELRIVSDSVRRCQKEIEKVQARLDTMTFYYGRLVHNAYKNRDSRMWYMYILASENIGQGMRRFGYLRQLSTQMNEQGRRIGAERARLQQERQRLDSLRTQARILRDERAAELNQLRKAEDQSQQLVNQLRKDKRKYQDQLASKRRQMEALNREIERLIQEEMDGGKKGKKGGSGGKKTKTQIDYVLSDQFASNKGKLPWPAEGRVVSHFGRNPHPVYTKLEMPFNNGVGIAVEKDAPVMAVFNGVVKQIIVVPGYNQCVLVQHGEYFTFYCKLGSVAVKAGEKVKTGQVLGHVATGIDEIQVHFQLWKGRDPQDPEKWLR